MNTLDDTFKKQFGITAVHDCFDQSGQKIVYIVDRNGQRMALKSFIYQTQRDSQEIQILKKYEGTSGIPRVLEVIEYKGRPIYFEEYIDGEDLEYQIANYANQPDKIITLLKSIIEIMAPIWTDGVVHRDLKPKNIKILTDGSPVILDFGIARDLSVESITKTGDQQPMTWDYASPEQYDNNKEAIGYRTDFFVLGIIAYKLLYQKHPFGTTKDEIASNMKNTDYAIDFGSPTALDSFLREVLLIDPSSRPRNPELLLAIL